MEQKSMSRYVRNRKCTQLINGSTKNIYYCHRLYYYKKKKNMIFKTSNLWGVTKWVKFFHLLQKLKNYRNLSVEFWKTHYRHGTEELGWMKLDVEIRIQIADTNHCVSVVFMPRLSLNMALLNKFNLLILIGTYTYYIYYTVPIQVPKLY